MEFQWIPMNSNEYQWAFHSHPLDSPTDHRWLIDIQILEQPNDHVAWHRSFWPRTSVGCAWKALSSSSSNEEHEEFASVRWAYICLNLWNGIRQMRFTVCLCKSALILLNSTTVFRLSDFEVQRLVETELQSFEMFTSSKPFYLSESNAICWWKFKCATSFKPTIKEQ